MAPLLNQLLEEASTECAHLSDEAKETGQTVDQLVERAEELVKGVVADGERAYRGMEVLAETLVEADTDLKTALDQPVRTAITEVMDRARDVRGQARLLEEKVQQGVAELAEERRKIQDDLQVRVETTATHFQRVAESMDELQQVADGRLQGTRSAITALQEAVEKGRAALEQAEDRLQQEMGEAETAARTQAAAYVAGIEALLKEQTVALIGLANAMVASHNKAVVDLRQKFAEAIPAALREAADGLKVAIERVDDLCENQSMPIQQRSTEITKVVGEALEALERIRTSAASAGAL
jgi:hypothetical protein